MPLHVWLPLAHPAAPSHVSALMSGVMTKVAVYGFVRIVFDLLGAPAWWWSVVVLLLGGATAVLGVLYALMQHDLKRLLAYHTVENIGIIFIGLGLALAFQANGMGCGRGAGADRRAVPRPQPLAVQEPAVLRRRRGADRDRRARHGAARRPDPPHAADRASPSWSAASAISALPPLNGFVSEWLTFQAILLSPDAAAVGPEVPGAGGRRAAGAVGGARRGLLRQGVRHHLPRPAAHAAAAERARGRPLLARRDVRLRRRSACSPASSRASSSTRWRRWSQTLVGGARMPVAGDACPGCRSCRSRESRSSYNGLLVFAVHRASRRALAAWVIHRFASRALRRAPAWDCGFPDPSPATQYTAGSFAQPIRRVFGTLVFRAREQVDMPPPGDLRAGALRACSCATWSGTASTRRSRARVGFAADRLNHLQFLTIRRYLSLVFLALVVLLLVLALWP